MEMGKYLDGGTMNSLRLYGLLFFFWEVLVEASCLTVFGVVDIDEFTEDKRRVFVRFRAVIGRASNEIAETINRLRFG